jgi:hypothetical protein
VFIGKFFLPQNTSFPNRDVWDKERQKTKAVIWRQDWDADHITYSCQHEHALQAGAHFQCMLSHFHAKHAVKKFPDYPPAFLPPTLLYLHVHNDNAFYIFGIDLLIRATYNVAIFFVEVKHGH